MKSSVRESNKPCAKMRNEEEMQRALQKHSEAEANVNKQSHNPHRLSLLGRCWRSEDVSLFG